jgi:hypothetical protein
MVWRANVQHRFEPHILRLWLLDRRSSTVYLARFFYGNGTARDVRDSGWRDRAGAPRPGIAPPGLRSSCSAQGRRSPGVGSHRFENRSFDHVRFGFEGHTALDFG